MPFNNVSLLRLDLCGGAAPGNKSFKLALYLEFARRRGIKRLLSFGGAWSNHLHALAAVGASEGLATIGIVRGEEQETAMLDDARRWGMELVRVSRDEYRRRDDPDYLATLQAAYRPCLVIPEGGGGVLGAGGCVPLGRQLRALGDGAPKTVVLPVGTGTTLAGLAAGLGDGFEVIGVSALRGAMDTDVRVASLLQGLDAGQAARWSVLHNHHCGGFARASADLKAFTRAFEAVEDVALEPVYTAKALFAVHELRRRGEWSLDEPLMVVHTGGLQGRRGFEWLAAG